MHTSYLYTSNDAWNWVARVGVRDREKRSSDGDEDKIQNIFYPNDCIWYPWTKLEILALYDYIALLS